MGFDTSLRADGFQMFNAKQGSVYFQSKSISNQRSDNNVNPTVRPLQGISDYNSKSPGIVVMVSALVDDHYLQDDMSASI